MSERELANAETRFTSPQVVRFGDVDHAGIVYYPRIFHYCHVAYEDWLALDETLSLPALIGPQGVGTPVVGVSASFHGPMAHGEAIAVELGVERVGERSFTLGFRVCASLSDAVAARVEVTHAMVDLAPFESMPIPGPLRAFLLGEG